MKYDLTNLDSRAFEALCADIVKKETKQRVEIFSPGMDGGIDGRFWFGDSKKGVLQAKHYPSSSYSTIKSAVKRELPKIQKIKPERYIFMTSGKITVTRKDEIKKELDPYIVREDDIWGHDEIQNYLLEEENFDIVQKYPQLFVYSTQVLKRVFGDSFKNLLRGGVNVRSDFLLDEIKNGAKKFVVTKDFAKALEKLSEKHVVVITGEAGIGKTMLSNMLSFEYVKEGYSFCAISDIKEAELILSHSKASDKIIFYYNDFLGESFARFMDGGEGSQIMLFINRVKKLRNVRLILNSRTTILNKAIHNFHSFTNGRIAKNEHLLTIENLNRVDKALMLYKHMYFSELDENYIDEIYNEKKYKKIIGHRNFSPRIIEYILEKDRIVDLDIDKRNYFSYIEKSLDNPKDIWADYFEKINLCTQKLIFLITFNQGKISDRNLKSAYLNYIEKNNIETSTESSFGYTIKIALNSLVERSLDGKEFTYTLFNPSVGDYVVNEYFCNEEIEITKLLMSLRNIESLKYLVSLESSSYITKDTLLKIQKNIFNSVLKDKLDEIDYEWLLFVIDIDSSNLDVKSVREILSSFVEMDRNDTKNFSSGEFYKLPYLLDYFDGGIDIKKYDFLWNYISNDMDDSDFEYLFRYIPEHDIQDDELCEYIAEKYEQYIKLNIDDHLDIDYGKYVEVERDGSYVVDESGILSEMVVAVEDNFVNYSFQKDFLEQTSFNISELLADINSSYTDRAVEAYDDGMKDDLDIDSYKERAYHGDSEESMIDEIFKR